MAPTAAERDLTPTERRTLEAVRDGKATRTYWSRGNTLKGKSIGSAVLRKLEMAGLIADKPGQSGHSTVPQVLTIRGERALAKKSEEEAWCPFCKRVHSGGATCLGHHP